MTERMVARCGRLFAVLLLATSPVLGAQTIHVPGDFARLDQALAAAQDGDKVLVAPGTYQASGGFLVEREIALIGEQGPEATILTMPTPTLRGSVLRVTADALVEGFTLTGGVGSFFVYPACNNRSAGGGLAVTGGSRPVVRNCWIRDNHITYQLDGLSPTYCTDGGGVYIEGSPLFQNCVIADNSALAFFPGDERGGGVFVASGQPFFQACTISGNFPDEGFLTPATRLRNSIAWPGDLRGGADVRHSNTAPLLPGTGNLSVDPQFVNPAGGDLQLQPGSPCIDAGNRDYVPSAGSEMDSRGGSRIIDGDLDAPMAVDMGAFEFSNLHLTVTRVSGRGIRLELTGQPLATLMLVSVVPDTTAFAPFGYLFLDLDRSLLLSWPTPPSSVELPRPEPYQGSRILFQAIGWAGFQSGNVSNRVAYHVN